MNIAKLKKHFLYFRSCEGDMDCFDVFTGADLSVLLGWMDGSQIWVQTGRRKTFKVDGDRRNWHGTHPTVLGRLSE